MVASQGLSHMVPKRWNNAIPCMLPCDAFPTLARYATDRARNKPSNKPKAD